MEYDKTVKDIENDTARVAASDVDPVVELCTRQEIGHGSVYLALTPKAARRLARHLKRAANVAEGKPAKAPKPQLIIDGVGDTWHLSDNGHYWCGTSPSRHAAWTRVEIRNRYGIREERP
jgi:hypothetical protein